MTHLEIRTARTRLHALVLALTVALVGLSTGGCDDAATSSATPASEVEVVPIPRIADASAITGLHHNAQQGTLAEGVMGRRNALQWTSAMVAVNGHETFNRAIAVTGADFLASQATQDKEASSYALDWGVSVAAGKAFGVRLRSQVSHPGSPQTRVTTATTYTVSDSDIVVPSSAIIDATHRSDLVAAMTRALRKANLLEDNATLNPDKAFNDLVLRVDGGALAVLTSTDQPLLDRDLVGLALPPALVTPALSREGTTLMRALAAQPDAPAQASAQETAPADTAGTAGETFAGFGSADPAPFVEAPRPRTSEPADCSHVRCVALTYDDGPGDHTARLLDILKQYNVPATFFVIGRHAAAHPELVSREVGEGHAVGIHTWSHPDLTKTSDSDIASQITRTSDLLASTISTRPPFTRPPYGAINSRVTHALGSLGQGIIMWDVDTEDWRNKNAQTVYDRALAGVHPGAIILMHDVHRWGPDATGRLIATLKSRGYVFVTIPQLFGDIQPGRQYFSQHEIH